MRNHFLFFFTALALSALGQSTEEKNVLEPISNLFKGMNLGDSALVHSAFASTINMATVYKDKNGNPAIRHEASMEKFLNAVGTPHAEKWSEPIWDTEIQIDGNLAQVWTKYAFYLGNKFSHCGVDAFQLFKNTDGKWKIFSLADTRQKEQCEIPEKIRSQFK
jgi:hypothetical protein